jgi:hypothetical protein
MAEALKPQTIETADRQAMIDHLVRCFVAEAQRTGMDPSELLSQRNTPEHLAQFLNDRAMSYARQLGQDTVPKATDLFWARVREGILAESNPTIFTRLRLGVRGFVSSVW